MIFRIVHLARQPGGFQVKQFAPATRRWRRVAWFPTADEADAYIQTKVANPIPL